jgi:hypothetical protein
MGHWQYLRLKMTTVKNPSSGFLAEDSKTSAGCAGVMSRFENLTETLKMTLPSSNDSGAFGSTTISGTGTPSEGTARGGGGRCLAGLDIGVSLGGLAFDFDGGTEPWLLDARVWLANCCTADAKMLWMWLRPGSSVRAFFLGAASST